jgi:hypothetical protein
MFPGDGLCHTTLQPIKKKTKKNNNDTFSENYESGFLAGGENRSDFRFTFLGRHFFFVFDSERKWQTTTT